MSEAMQNTAEELDNIAAVNEAQVEDNAIVVEADGKTVSESMQSEMMSRGFAVASIDSRGENVEVTFKNITDF